MKYTTQICPKCESLDVQRSRQNPMAAAMGLPSKYTCNRCNYTNFVFPEVQVDAPDTYKPIEKKKIALIFLPIVLILAGGLVFKIEMFVGIVLIGIGVALGYKFVIKE